MVNFVREGFDTGVSDIGIEGLHSAGAYYLAHHARGERGSC